MPSSYASPQQRTKKNGHQFWQFFSVCPTTKQPSDHRTFNHNIHRSNEIRIPKWANEWEIHRNAICLFHSAIVCISSVGRMLCAVLAVVHHINYDRILLLLSLSEKSKRCNVTQLSGLSLGPVNCLTICDGAGCQVTLVHCECVIGGANNLACLTHSFTKCPFLSSMNATLA